MTNRHQTRQVLSTFVRRIAASLALLFSLSAFGVAAANTVLGGRVIGILDGDTIEILDASRSTHRIRLTGIDAPEKAQPFGQRAKEHLSGLVFGQRVEVQAGKSDRYGRTVGKVIVKGMDANLAQVTAGFAWHYKQYASEQSASDRALYASAEDQARRAHAGLWRDPQPMSPWEWRHGGKDQPTITSLASGCPCSGESHCTGAQGGHYCIAPNGKKRYR